MMSDVRYWIRSSSSLVVICVGRPGRPSVVEIFQSVHDRRDELLGLSKGVLVRCQWIERRRSDERALRSVAMASGRESVAIFEKMLNALSGASITWAVVVLRDLETL